MPAITKAVCRTLLSKIQVLFISEDSLNASFFELRSQGTPEPWTVLKALTADANLQAYGYRLDAEGVRTLACLFQIGNVIDPATLVGILEPNPSARPMYPDFPQQVLGMEEAAFRLDQMRHYSSTYGVECLVSCLGTDVQVMRGWQPLMVETPKSRTDEQLLELRTLTLAVGTQEASELAWRLITGRTQRMDDDERALLAALPVPEGFSWKDVPFHENLLALIQMGTTMQKGTDAEAGVAFAKRFSQHPGDVIKAIMDERAHLGSDAHFPTSKRRRYVRLLESFDVASFAENLANDQQSAKLALGLVSFNRFARSEAHLDVVRELRDGRLMSWNATKEAAYRSGNPEQAAAILKQCPGVMLREMTRLLAAGMEPQDLERHLGEVLGQLSAATLLNNANALGNSCYNRFRIAKWEAHAQKRGVDSVKAAKAIQTLLNKGDERREIARVICLHLLEGRLRGLETPLRGKRVFVDPGDIVLELSQVRTNLQTADKGYASAGLAWRIPDDARVIRAFVFWDDHGKRVDLDLHSVDNRGGHVGWNGDFNANGITTSGDITTSQDSAEYIDVDIERALAAGIEAVDQSVDYFNGEDFSEVATAFAGVLVVGGTAPDVALYTGGNVIARNDLTKFAAKRLRLCHIDLRRRAVIPTTDAAEGTSWATGPAFSAEDFLAMLLRSQGATRVENRGHADIVLTVARGKDGELSLIDEGWFVF